MGMELIGRRLAADELRAVLDDPASADTLLYGDLDDPDAEMPEPGLDLDKSWHGIHYLLPAPPGRSARAPARRSGAARRSVRLVATARHGWYALTR